MEAPLGAPASRRFSCSKLLNTTGKMPALPSTSRKMPALPKLLPVALLLLVSLTACKSISPLSRMAEARVKSPHAWAASKEGSASVDDEWLKCFGDSKLESLVAKALGGNFDLKLAAARLEKARGQAELAGVAAIPTLDISGTPSRTKRNFIGFPLFGGSGDGPATNTNNQFSLSLNLNWELDVWGRIAAGRSAAKASYEAAQQDYRAARTSMAAAVARAWFQLTEAKAQLTLAREAEVTFQETADAVRERFKGGAEQGGAAAQLRLAQADTATAKASVVERDQAMQAAARQLEILLGRYPAGSVAGAAKLPNMPKKAPAGLPSELLQRRPDLLAAERRHAAQGARITEGWKSLYPRIALTSSAGTSSENLGDLLKSEFGVWQLAGNLVQPVFAGGRIIGELKVYYSEESETLNQLESTLLKAFGEVEAALANERDLATREAAIMEAMRLAEEAQEAAKADYTAGVGDLLTVLSAQSRLVSSRSAALAMHRARLENRITLHLALGGDFKVHGSVPTLPEPKPKSAVQTWWKRQLKP